MELRWHSDDAQGWCSDDRPYLEFGLYMQLPVPVFFQRWLYITGSYAKKILDFPLPISDICLLPHFCDKLNLQFSELNITPSVRPNLGIFKNFWYWISIFRQSLLVKKTPFELNLTSFKWASARLGIFQVILFGFVILQEGNKGTINTGIVQWSEIEK